MPLPAPTYTEHVHRSAVPFVILGTLSLLVGGLLSAVSAAAPSYTAAWAVAYLVLVGGVVQLALGIGQARLAPTAPSAAVIAAQAVAFNAANAAVLAGTAIGMAWLVDAGAAVLVTALALFVWGVRGATAGNRWLLYGFRLVVVIVLVSAPIGLIIAHSKAG